MSDQDNIRELGERMRRVVGGDPEKLRAIRDQIKGIAADARDLRPVDLIRPLQPGPSRAEVWARFAVAFAIAPRLGQSSADAIAMHADEMIAEYDKRFTQGEADHEDDEAPRDTP
jgi:hypothetical protein